MVGNNTPSSSTINDRGTLTPLTMASQHIAVDLWFPFSPILLNCPKMIHACGCLISLTIESRNALNIRYIHLGGGGGDILPFLSSL
ncbi:unnamed protein product [Rhizophagus irregularis]|nr:unnamed protein product [Rhizophagus irregularis]